MKNLKPFDIDSIIATCRRDSRCVSGSERRVLCDEIDRLRTLAVRAWHSFRSTSPHPWCQDGLRNEDIEELVKLAGDTREGK